MICGDEDKSWYWRTGLYTLRYGAGQAFPEVSRQGIHGRKAGRVAEVEATPQI